MRASGRWGGCTLHRSPCLWSQAYPTHTYAHSASSAAQTPCPHPHITGNQRPRVPAAAPPWQPRCQPATAAPQTRDAQRTTPATTRPGPPRPTWPQPHTNPSNRAPPQIKSELLRHPTTRRTLSERQQHTLPIHPSPHLAVPAVRGMPHPGDRVRLGQVLTAGQPQVLAAGDRRPRLAV